MMRLDSETKRAIAGVFKRLDYKKLGAIYCEEGGAAFWRARREPCRRLGSALAGVLRGRLPSWGASLYVGAGVAELPALLMEALELGRPVLPLTLRRAEARVLNAACRGLPFRYECKDAAKAQGTFDHIWAVSVFNDPERFPDLSALSYGRADPVTFAPHKFIRERKAVTALVAACLKKLALPALVTTSVEEVPWIVDWCDRRGAGWDIEKRVYRSAIVEDPVCFIRVCKK